MRTLVRTHRNTPTTTNFFDDFFVRDFFGFPNAESKSPKTIPAVNVKETEHEFIVDVAIPGVKKEDVKVELNENVLTISSEVKKEEGEQQEIYTRKEFSYTTFKRSFTIDNDAIDTEKIDAKVDNGVLSVHLSKKAKVEPEQKVKTITVV
ncbi:MAG: Hsp20 family protein [Sphingobacteriales bacterium]|jgi:HSP20 family protein|nr:MAG: Hsp20 family protein [Sphingobacteriales bacterium]